MAEFITSENEGRKKLLWATITYINMMNKIVMYSTFSWDAGTKEFF